MFLSMMQQRKSCRATPWDFWFFSPRLNKYSMLKINLEVLNESL